MKKSKRNIVILIIAFLAKRTVSPPPFEFTSTKEGGPGSKNIRVCVTTSLANVVYGWFNPGQKIAFNIQGSLTTNQFIQNSAGSQKQYNMLERGSATCYTPEAGYTGWLLLGLVVEPHPSISGKCIVTRVITTNRLTSCGGSEVDLQVFLATTVGTYDQVGVKSSFNYDQTLTPDSKTDMMNLSINLPFSYLDIDEHFVEFIVLMPSTPAKEVFNTAFNKVVLDDMNRAYLETTGQFMTAKKYVERNVWDGVRGHILIPDPSDPFGAYRNLVAFRGRPFVTMTLLIHFFITKPTLMTSNDVLLLSIDTRPIFLANPDHTLKSLKYKLKVVRDTVNNEFKLTLMRYEGSSMEQQVTLTVPFSPSNSDWLHFGVSLGYGVLYFIDNTNARFKRTDGVHAWVDSTAYHADMTYQEDETILSAMPPDTPSKTIASQVILTASLKVYTDAGMTTETNLNNFGVRVWEAKGTSGAFPGYKLTNNPSVDNRCFFSEAFFQRCNLYTFLRSSTDVNPKSLKVGVVSNRKPYCELADCPYCLNTHQCVNAKPGRNEDLFYDVVAFVQESWPSTRYNSSKQSHANEFKRVVNNQGKEYFIRCPPYCKTKKIKF